MKRYTAKGERIKQLRQDRDYRSTQKEFAFEIGISERQLRDIENANAEIPREVVDRIARALGVSMDDIVFATDGPQLVSEPEVPAAVPAKIETPKREVVPRHDTTYASAVYDETKLFDEARRSHTLVSHVMMSLTEETSGYAQELIGLLQSLTWEKHEPWIPFDAVEEIELRRRLRQLLVLLKGNDVWVYQTDNIKTLPEGYEVKGAGEETRMEMQFIIAFAPPGEYGETNVTVPIDHGRPFILHGPPYF